MPWEATIGLVAWVAVGIAIVRMVGPQTSLGEAVTVAVCQVVVGAEMVYGWIRRVT